MFTKSTVYLLSLVICFTKQSTLYFGKSTTDGLLSFRQLDAIVEIPRLAAFVSIHHGNIFNLGVFFVGMKFGSS